MPAIYLRYFVPIRGALLAGLDQAGLFHWLLSRARVARIRDEDLLEAAEPFLTQDLGDPAANARPALEIPPFPAGPEPDESLFGALVARRQGIARLRALLCLASRPCLDSLDRLADAASDEAGLRLACPPIDLRIPGEDANREAPSSAPPNPTPAEETVVLRLARWARDFRAELGRVGGISDVCRRHFRLGQTRSAIESLIRASADGPLGDHGWLARSPEDPPPAPGSDLAAYLARRDLAARRGQDGERRFDRGSMTWVELDGLEDADAFDGCRPPDGFVIRVDPLPPDLDPADRRALPFRRSGFGPWTDDDRERDEREAELPKFLRDAIERRDPDRPMRVVRWMISDGETAPVRARGVIVAARSRLGNERHRSYDWYDADAVPTPSDAPTS